MHAYLQVRSCRWYLQNKIFWNRFARFPIHYIVFVERQSHNFVDAGLVQAHDILVRSKSVDGLAADSIPSEWIHQGGEAQIL